MKRKLLLTLLTAITVIYYFPIVNVPVGAIDESFALVGAERTLRGQIPYKDFSSEYPPGQYYALAALFKVFGVSVTTERIYDILIKSLLSVFIFLIISLLTSDTLAFAGWGMSLVWILNSPYPAYSVYPSMLFIFMSVYYLLTHIKDKRHFYTVLSGVLVVLSILFRHDLGGFTAFAVAFILLLRRITRIESWKSLVLFIMGGIIAGLPVLTYFIANSDISSLINDLVIIPFTYLQHQTLPYPSLSRWNLPFYTFPLVIVTGAITSIILIKRRKDEMYGYALLLVSLIGIFCFDRIRMRPDKAHLLPVALSGILLAPLLLHVLLRELSSRVWLKRASYVMFIAIFGLTLSKPVEVIAMILSRSNGYAPKVINPDIERAKFQYVFEDIQDVVSFIKSHSSRDDYIYVGVKNHDRFIFNDLLIYFLAGRNYASRYHGLNPGVQTTSKVQEQMISEFKKNPPRVIVLGSRTWNEPNLSGVDTKVDLLDNFIANNFTLITTYGSYEIWMDKRGI